MQLRNERGFSLVEIAVTLGISGIFTLMFMRYMMTSHNQDAHMNYLAQVNDTLTSLQYTLSKPDTCNKVFNGMTVSLAGTPVPATGLKVVDTVLLKTGDSTGFHVQDIKLYTSTISPNSAFDLEITFVPLDKSGFNMYFAPATSIIKKRMTIIGTRDATNKIASCGPIVSDVNEMAVVDFCTSLRDLGQIVVEDGVKKCKYRSTYYKCDPPNVPSGFANTGRISCTAIAGRLTLENIFDFSMKECPTKVYTLYQDPTTKKMTVGCPDPVTKNTDLPLP